MDIEQSINEIGNTLTEAEREHIRKIEVLNMLVEAINSAQTSLKRVQGLIHDIHTLEADGRYGKAYDSCVDTQMRLGWLASQAGTASNEVVFKLMLDTQKRK